MAADVRWTGQVANDTRTALLKAQTALRMRQPTSIGDAQLSSCGGRRPPRRALTEPR